MKTAFSSIKKGLQDVIKNTKGSGGVVCTHRLKPVDVKLVRQKIGMTQIEFAASFGFGLGTLRHWERGDRNPRGPSLVLLNVIANDPQSVLQVLSY